MKIREITNYLESLAPLSSQADFDNCGLIVGDASTEVTSAIICLDCVEAIVDEAIRKGSNLIIAHHPIVFKGLKKLNGKNYIERTVIKAIQHGIAIYAIHTNLDHYRFGVNYEIGQRLGLENLQILDPVENALFKLNVYVPIDHLEKVKSAVFEAGAGEIGNYSECSFSSEGTGTFTPNELANPFEGEKNNRSTVSEVKLELLVTSHSLNSVVKAMKQAHPYEEVAYDIISLKNQNAFEGAGMVGELKEPMDEQAFLSKVKTNFKCEVIRHTKLMNKPIKRVAFCGGSGSFLLNKAKRANADIFITGDYKYHDFFDAENELVIADIGHFESEQFTINLIADILKKKFHTFVVHLTEENTNPINYF
ncbi:MAG: Nif3-like dinuclear metal center hexameric protein [Fluviicola sp.]|nr:Nif3-like dinuclear metal center hexameric protein [Fluviicola sp.]